MSPIQTTAVLGAGVIGASWAALFLAAGKRVQVFDLDPGAEKRVRDYIEAAWPTLIDLGLAQANQDCDLVFTTSLPEAVRGTDFIQENVPERIDVKHAVFAEMEPHLNPDAVVASSASGLMVKEMQTGWKDPSRFILGHPFNPPHLIPLVELLGNEKTADGVLETAEAFYRQVGKVTIRVNREVPGHVANRLQAALWREAIHLMNQGVASVEDIDTAVWSGPGLRWGAMGPTMLFHLGAGDGGLEEFTGRYSSSFNRWWDDLGDPRLDPELSARLVAGVKTEASGRDQADLSAERDALILATLKARRRLS